MKNRFILHTGRLNELDTARIRKSNRYDFRVNPPAGYRSYITRTSSPFFFPFQQRHAKIPPSSPRNPQLERPERNVGNGREAKRQLEADVAAEGRLADADSDGADEPHLAHAL